MEFKHISLALIAMMGILFFACNDDEEETTNLSSQPEAQLSTSNDSTLYIADISDMGNITYSLSQPDLDSFIHLVTGFDNVSNSEVIYYSNDDYYALTYNYSFQSNNGITYIASALSPLMDDGIHSYINVKDPLFSHSCIKWNMSSGWAKSNDFINIRLLVQWRSC